MGGGKKPSKYVRALGLVLLALTCITGVELAVCRVMDPPLFRKIVHPVVELTQAVQACGSDLLLRLQHIAQPQHSQEQADPISQEILEPEETSIITQDPEITQFVQRQDNEVLTGGVVELVYFNQGEEPWADALFGRDPISGFGCGPTVMSMVVSTLGTEVVDPAQMAQAAYEEGYCAPGSGSYLSIVEGMAQYFGLGAQSCGEISPEELCQRLATGELMVALMGPGHFTKGGHFIVLRGVTLTGQVLVADPNSRERSLALWEPQLILDELSASRTSGAPLWSFNVLNG